MKIAFAGYGIEAESAYKYYRKKFPDAEFVVYDANATTKKPLPHNVEFYGNVKEFHDIDADVVVRTPPIAPGRITTRGTVTSVTKEFFSECRLPIIAVTGTKGKGTTSTLIAKMLERAGKNVWLVGNIGVPALDVLDEVNKADDGIVVYEASSFQLWDLHQGPRVAVVLKIEPEHLDVHGSFEEYINAKAHIAKYQTPDDKIVYYDLNENARTVAAQSSAYRIPYTGKIVDNTTIMFQGEPLVKVNEVGLKGAHNLQNIHAALLAASVFTDDRQALADAIRDFKGLPYRIEELGKRYGVLYVNDSFSTAPQATLAAVRAYAEPISLIMGGYDRGGDLSPLVTELITEKHIKRIYLIGQTAAQLKHLLEEKGYAHAVIMDSLHEAVDAAKSGSEPGDVVLFSPGCASFDMFKDFTDRGEQFRALVASIQREFIFEGYSYDATTREATFRYSFDEYDYFSEKILFEADDGYDEDVLDRALQLAFLVIGTSYGKLYSGARVTLRGVALDEWQAEFMNEVYQEGLSQYAYENQLTRSDLLRFTGSQDIRHGASDYDGVGILSLQSGGKDSLLTAALLERSNHQFDSLYVSSRGGAYPKFIDELPGRLLKIERSIDLAALKKHVHSGGLNGHIPVTFIVLAVALVQAVLLRKKTVIASIGHEGEEPHAWIDNLAITHQWSKTWQAEQLFASYVGRYVADSIQVGSLLRRFTELKIAELFVENAWSKYGHSFSSCNVANYKQGNDNSILRWCGDCPKCANSYLLFAPFLKADELQSIFSGQDLFTKPQLRHTFEGLLGVNDVMKPFECVGEIDELRYAYHRAQQNGGYQALPFDVPESQFDYAKQYESQDWTTSLF